VLKEPVQFGRRAVTLASPTAGRYNNEVYLSDYMADKLQWTLPTKGHCNRNLDVGNLE